MCREVLPRLGRRVEYRLARFDPDTGELDLQHLASLIDARTKLVCCTGASNFLGTRNPLAAVRALADASGYCQPGGEHRSYLLVDAAQLVPGSFVDVQALGVDYLAFSFHQLLAPFGVGVLYAREHLLAASLSPDRPTYFGTSRPLGRAAVRAAMDRVRDWNQLLTGRALDGLGAIGGITVYGPRDAARRTSLVAFNLAGRDPHRVAEALDKAGVESRAGCHCATLAHHALGLTPPASCRLSFYLYNTLDEVDQAVAAVAAIGAARWNWHRPRAARLARRGLAPAPPARAGASVSPWPVRRSPAP